MGTLTVQRQILLAPWRQSLGEGRIWGWVLAAAVAAIPTVATLVSRPAQAPNVALGTAVLVLQVVWLTLFTHLLRQNHPVAARLVPGHVRHLRESLTGSYLLLAGLGGLLLSRIAGEALACVLILAVLMLVLATLARWPLLWAGFGLIPASVPLLRRTPVWTSLRDGLADFYTQRPLVLSVLALLLLPWLLNLHLKGGGSRHFSSYASGERMRLAMRQASVGGSSVRYQGRFGAWLSHLFSAPYRAWLRHLLARARPEARHVMARVEMAMGPSTHWTAQASTFMLFALVMLAVVGGTYLGFGVNAWSVRGSAAFGLSLGLMSAAIVPVLSQRNALWKARREQALLMLVPGMPRGAALNRLLGFRLMRNFLGSWGIATALLMVFSHGTPAFPACLGYALACLPFGLLLWSDWSRVGDPSARKALPPMLILVVAGLVLAGLLFRSMLPTGWVLAAVLIPSALAGVWRWRRMVAAPQAFPVGRWAGSGKTGGRF